MNGNIAPLDATSTTDELRIPIAVALGLVAKLTIKISSAGMDRGIINPCETDQNQIRRGAQGNTFAHLQKKWQEKHGSPSKRF